MDPKKILKSEDDSKWQVVNKYFFFKARRGVAEINWSQNTSEVSAQVNCFFELSQTSFIFPKIISYLDNIFFPQVCLIVWADLYVKSETFVLAVFEKIIQTPSIVMSLFLAQKICEKVFCFQISGRKNKNYDYSFLSKYIVKWWLIKKCIFLFKIFSDNCWFSPKKKVFFNYMLTWFLRIDIGIFVKSNMILLLFLKLLKQNKLFLALDKLK